MPLSEGVADVQVTTAESPPRASSSPPRHVILVINNMGGGGAERVVATLANHLHSRLGWAVTILTLEAAPVAYRLLPGVKVRALHGKRITAGVRSLLGVPLLAVELAWFLRRHPADAVMSFLVRSNLILVLTQWLGNRRPILISERCATDALYTGDTVKSRMMRRLISTAYPWAHRIVAISQGVKDALVRLGVPADRVRVIYNPQDLQQIAGAVDATPAPRPSGRPFTIVAVGRLTEQKDYPTLLIALQHLYADGIDARLIVFGEGPDEQELRALAQRLGVAERVEWRGWVPAPHAAMAGCDAFVLASRWEGFGNVIVEAMACGVPVVCTDCQSGPREILADGEYGILTPVGESAALAAALRRLAGDAELRATLRERGLVRARDFEVSRIADQYVDVLSEAFHAHR